MTFNPVPLNSETAVDVVAVLSLSVGRNYGAQYQGPGAVSLRESDSTTRPDITEGAAYASATDALRLTPKVGEGIWVWATGTPQRLLTGAQFVVWEE